MSAPPALDVEVDASDTLAPSAAPAMTIVVESPVPAASDAASAAAASSVSPDAAVPAVAASSSDADMTPEQHRARQLYARWQKTFLGSVVAQSEEYLLAMLREGEDLIASGHIDLNRAIAPTSGSTLLHTVASALKLKVVQWLLAHGANPNQPNAPGNTPLHLLCDQANKETAPALIQAMIDYGGDVDQKDASDPPQSGAEKAAAVGFDVRKQLSFAAHDAFVARRNGTALPGDSGADVAGTGMTDAERQAAVEKARLVFRKLSTLFLGLEAEGVSKAVDDAIVRILTANLPHVAAKILILSKPPLAESEGNLKTFAHLAVIARRPHILQVLLQALTLDELDQQDENGDTPLHIAVAKIEEGESGRAIVEMLLEAGASVTVTNYLKGLTPLQMLPADVAPETRAWLAQKVSVRRRDNVTSGKPAPNTFANRFLGPGGAAAVGAAPGMPVPMSPSQPERQDRAGARAMMARMASAMGVTTPSLGGMTAGIPTNASIGAGTPKSGAAALELMKQKNPARQSGAGLGQLQGALQQIVATKGVPVTPSAASSSGIPKSAARPAIGPGGASSGLAKAERALGLDALFHTLDLNETNSLAPTQLLALHRELHACGGSSQPQCTLALVHQVLESVFPTGQCTRTNLLEVLASLELLCAEQAAARWDFRLFDIDGVGSLSTVDGTGGYTPAPAELVWSVNHADAPVQTRYEEYLTRRMKQEKTKQPPREARWTDMQAELMGKLPTLS